MRTVKLTLLLALCTAGCNALFGVDKYDLGAEAGGGGEGATTTTASSTAGGGEGGSGATSAGGAGGTGGSGGAGGGGFLNIGGAAVLAFGERAGADVDGVTADTSVRTATPTQNFGAAVTLNIDGGSGVNTALLRFDLSMIAPGTTVIDAHIDFFTAACPACAGPGTTVTVHALVETWVAGDGNGVPGFANFTQRTASEAWTTAGARLGSHEAATLASYSDPLQGEQQVLGVGNDVVQGWIDNPASNYGFALVTNQTDGTAVVSSEGASDQRPLLILALSDG